MRTPPTLQLEYGTLYLDYMVTQRVGRRTCNLINGRGSTSGRRCGCVATLGKSFTSLSSSSLIWYRLLHAVVKSRQQTSFGNNESPIQKFSWNFELCPFRPTNGARGRMIAGNLKFIHVLALWT